MKLVKLLAKELNEWPDDLEYAHQDHCGEIRFYGGKEGTTRFDFMAQEKAVDRCASGLSRDGSRITKSQWQAEREKMNKPKWIRHRGGWMPVGAATIVEVRLRCGEIQKHEACEFLWRHQDCDSAVNIMTYRVIEETKDQEIEEVKVADVKLEMMQGDSWVTIGSVSSDFGASVFDGGQPPKDEEVKNKNIGALTYNLEIDATEATKQIDSLVAKWGQIESPLKWRDEIIELEAYEEEFRREREKLIRKLESEGFKLIDQINCNLDKIDQTLESSVDMSDWRNWKEGDVFEVVKRTDYFTVGNRYSVKYTANTDAPITAIDDDGDEFCLLMEEIKFIRHP